MRLGIPHNLADRAAREAARVGCRSGGALQRVVVGGGSLALMKTPIHLIAL